MSAVVSIALGIVLIVGRDAVARLIARDQRSYGPVPAAQSPRGGRLAVTLVGAGFIVFGALDLLGGQQK